MSTKIRQVCLVVLLVVMPLFTGAFEKVEISMTLGGPGDGTFKAPTSAAVGDDGRIYVADAGNSRISVFSSDGAPLFTFGEKGKLDGQFYEPFGVAYYDGLVFVTDSRADSAQVFDGDGKFQYRFGGSGSDPGRLKGPMGIAVSGQGRLYIAENGGSRVSIFTPQGLYLGAISQTGDGLDALQSPTHIALDRFGNLYVADARQGKIHVYDALGDPKRVIDAKGMGIERLSGLAITPHGYIVAADAPGRIFLLDPEGKSGRPFGSPGSGRGQFKDIQCVTIGPDGRLYVADSGNNRVEALEAEFPADGAAHNGSARNLPRAVLEPPIKFPALDVAIGKNGLILALVEEGAQVKAYTRMGVEKFTLSPGDGAGKATGSRIAAGAGRVYVSDIQNDNISVYDEGGRFLFTFGARGKDPGKFNSPGGLAVSGKLYVADTGNDRVQAFSLDGVFLEIIGGGSVDFKRPVDVTTGPDGKLYIADAGNRRIVRLSKKGALDGIIGDKETFGQLVAVRVDDDGRIFVLEAGRNERILVLDQKGKALMRLGARGSGPGDFLDPHGMDFNMGTLYLADTGNERILRVVLMDVPAAPTGLKISAGFTASTLSWKRGSESFLKGYRVYAVDERGKKEAIGETEKNKFIAPNPSRGGQVKFTVTAYSRDGLESPPAPPITDWGRVGLAKAGKNDCQGAVEAFSKALDADPGDAFSLEQQGMCLIELGEYDDAKSVFEKLLGDRNGAEQALLGLGIVAMEQGRYADAEKNLNKSLGYNSQNPRTRRYLAELYVRQRHWQPALENAREAAALDPLNPRVHEMMGLAYMNLRLFGKASKALGMAISLDPDNPDLYLELARIYRSRGNDESARDVLLKAVAVAAAPKRVEPYLALGLLYMDTNRLDEADNQAQKALGIDPENAAAYQLKGKIFLARGKQENAIEAFQKALSLEPGDPDTLIGIAKAYMSIGQKGEAASAIDKARALHPKNESILFAAAEIKAAQGDTAGAVKALDELLRVNPESHEAHLANGKLHLERKEYQAAADNFQKASKLLPGNVEPLILLAEAYRDAGRMVEAGEALREALNIDMESAPAHFALGSLYAARQEYELAAPELKLAAYIDPDNAEYHHALGMAYYETSELDAAVAELTRASQLAADDETIKRDLNLAIEARRKYLKSGNRPPVEIARIDIKPLFAGISKSYEDVALGTAVLKNNGRDSIYKVKVSFRIKGFMDTPTVYVIDRLKPRSTVEAPLKVTLSGRALRVKRDTPVLGVIKVEYVRGRSPQRLSATAPFTLYGPNAVIWSDREMTGAFITPADWPVAEFARGAMDAASGAGKPENFPETLYKAIAVFEALGAYKMSYLEDPNRPYRQSSREIERVDYVQYPRDTMRLRSGDCDDLTVLFAALMENIGVETAIADLPGHVLPLVDAGVEPSDITSITGDVDKLIVAGGKVWIPVELTSVGVEFAEAWAQGAILCRKAMEEGKFALISTHESWKKYAPAALNVTNWKPVIPTEIIQARVKKELTLIGRQRIDAIAAQLLKNLQRDPDNVELLLQLGVLYAEHGYADNAREVFEKVLEVEPKNAFALNNIGNIHFMNKNYQAALEKYRAAEAAKPDDAEIKINLSLTYYRMGNIEKARQKFEEGVEADPEITEFNPILKELLYKP